MQNLGKYKQIYPRWCGVIHTAYILKNKTLKIGFYRDWLYIPEERYKIRDDFITCTVNCISFPESKPFQHIEMFRKIKK